jgi:prolyl-tRNA synthetase
MLWSKLFIPTLRDDPAEAEVPSHRLLLRAGYVRQLAAGIYSYLYLAQRSLNKIQRIVREEMDAIGAQEVHLPALNPAEVWQESGRWDAMGDNMFRLKDRFGRDLCLGMTHEEVIAALARGELRSYKQLPQIWYQIQTKFRDEQRPKSGLLRVRQFLMKDSYSFDIDAAGLDASFQKHYEAYMKIFSRCGLRVIPVEADSGAMGGSQSMEFMVPSEAGEDFIVECPQCGYAANLEKAVTLVVSPAIPDPEGEFTPEPFHTPGQKSIADVAAFTALPATSQMKSLVMVADGKPVLAMLRGDHQLSETKFAAATGATDVRQAFAAEIVEWFGAEPGSLGPVGIAKLRILADKALEGRRNMIAGANRNDYHLRNVTPERDFQPEYFDLRQSAAEDLCAACGGAIAIHKTIETGHIFKLGYKYSESMGLRVDGPEGGEVTPIMGSYGIGIERILCSAIEQRHDANGMILPPAIAPFLVVITPVNNTDAALRAAAEAIYQECIAKGIDALYDDRDERPGVKFKDADLIGVPYRITLGGKKLAQGMVELHSRESGETRDVPPAEVVSRLLV